MQTEGGFIPAYTGSPFLILSHFNKTLAVRTGEVSQHNEIGVVVEPGAYVVNNDFYPLVEDLKALYPEANIIRANELPTYIQEETEGAL